MKNTFWRRLGTLVATAGLLGSLGVVAAVAPVLAAVDPGCTALGGADGAGTCVVPSGTHVVSGSITVAENLQLATGAILNASASGVSLTVNPGNFEMLKGSQITGNGNNITVNVPNGDMFMRGTAGTNNCGYTGSGGLYSPSANGAQIISRPATIATTITINVGNYPNSTNPKGSFNMERCSLIDVSKVGGSAGTVIITAGHDADIDGLVLSESTLTGTSNQAPGGGPITVQTGCVLTVSATGVVSSRGADPGADLVHLEGCDVHIDGLVQSTGSGHSVPTTPANHCATGVHSGKPANSTGCVEIIGQNITVSTTGEVNANVNSTGNGGPQGSSWLDMYAYLNITINGKTGAADHFSVHADSLSGTDTTPNVVTVLAGANLTGEPGILTATGKAISASDTANGSFGGTINAGAAGVAPTGAVILNGATLQAAGDNFGGAAQCDSGSGDCGKGGLINVQSFHDLISWTSGLGDVRPDNGVSPPAGKIILTACTTITIGASFGSAVPQQNPGICAVPVVPSYITAAFAVGDPIWDACTPSTKSGMKFNDLNGNGAKDAGEPGLQNWPITITPPAGPAVTVLTDASGKYSFNLGGPGVYTVCEGVSPVAPATWVQTFPNAATVHAGETIINTCPAPNTRGYQFTVAGQVTLADNDFGNWVPPTKTGVKWNDVNGNGVRDAGDNGLPGWVIQALDAANVVKASATTDANGIYTLTFPTGGTFKICEIIQAGFAQTFPNATTPDPAAPNDKVLLGGCGGLNGYTVIVQSGSVLTKNDFGNHPPTFGPPDKTGLKWNDLNGNHIKDAGEPVLADWPINLYGPGAPFALSQSTTTAADGTYHFTIPSPGPWRVCEGPAPASLPGLWTQTFPQAATPPPAGESITTACPGPNTVGYAFTAVSGQNLTGDNFGNFQPTGCQKQTTLDIMNAAFPGNKGPDDNVLLFNGEKVQDAVDNAADTNGDGYIIIMVIAHSDFSLGGSSNEKVVISKDYTATPATNLPFGLFGCSVTLTGGGTDPAVWIKDTAKGAPITINGRTSTIFVADLHGSNSAVGVEADGTNRYLRNNCTGTCGQGANTIGILVKGDNNTVHNGEATGNTGDGIVVTGTGNLVTGGDAFSNGGNGFVITGNSNSLTNNDSGDRNKGNGGDGFKVAGFSNNLDSNTASANGAIGFEISGGGPTSTGANLLKNNKSNNGASGADTENAGAEFSLNGWIKNNGGGNKIDGVTIPNAAKISTFPTSGNSFNYTSTVLGE